MIEIIYEDEVHGLIDRREALDVIAATYRAAARGRASVSTPSSLHLKGPTDCATSFKVKGALLEDDQVAGFRLVADRDDGGEGTSFVYVVDASTARPLGLVSELWLHRLRTASTGIVTCRALAPPNLTTIALVGTGRIAEEFVRLISLAFPGVPVVIASRSASRAADAADRWQSLTENPLRAAQTVPSAVCQADMVVTISDANEVLFPASALKPDALVCAMGGQHEFDAEVLERASSLIVDEIDFVCTAGNGAHWIRSGQITRSQLEARVHASVGEILLEAKPRPTSGLVLAIVQGMAVCDLSLANLALKRKSGRKD